MSEKSPRVSFTVGRSVVTLLPDWSAGEALLVEATPGGVGQRHLLEGVLDAITLDGGSHWAVGGVLSELGSTVEAVLSNSRELTVQTDGEGWLTLVPVGDIDELTVTFRTGERVVHRSQVHIREFLPRPPTYYVPIDEQ
jgi:hypothetical protein